MVMLGRLFGVPPRFSVKVLSMVIVVILFASPANLFSYPRTFDDLIEASCEGGNQDAKRILIAYDTIHGSTAEVADKIGKELCSRGFKVDVRFVGNTSSIEEYDAVILGSAIYEFNWLPDARRFFKKLLCSPVFQTGCGLYRLLCHVSGYP
jgi:hypothetical protein